MARLRSLIAIISFAFNTICEAHLQLYETASIRKYFYVGGSYQENGQGQRILRDHIYVEYLAPLGGARKEYPLVFIHGQALTGANWLNKPDGRPGWTSYFLSQGYDIYLVDQTYRGRSPWNPEDGSMLTFTAEYIEQRQTATRRYNLWPQASLHSQWPGNGSIGDPIFDEYYASVIQYFKPGAVQQQTSFQSAGAALMDKIGKPVILFGHSQGGILPWLLADARPDLVHTIVALEPSGPPFENAIFTSEAARSYGLTDAPLTYDPPVLNPENDLIRFRIESDSSLVANCTLQSEGAVRKLKNFAGIPVVLVTSETGSHVQYDWCTVRYLQQAGVNTKHVLLERYGLYGNGHMMFLEENSDEIAELIGGVLEQDMSV